MTAPDHPMPSAGGTYMRDPVTGALTEVQPDPVTGELVPVIRPAGADAATAPPEEVAGEGEPASAAAAVEEPSSPRGRKTPVKEG